MEKQSAVEIDIRKKLTDDISFDLRNIFRIFLWEKN